MRRFQASLIAAGLATTLSSAAAGPSARPATKEGDRAAPPVTETYRAEWSTSRGRLGVMVMSLTPDLRRHFGAGDRGVLVAQVEPGTPAAHAGLAAGDVITAVDGHPIDDAADVLAALDDVHDGARVSIALVRDRQARTLDVTLTGAARADAHAALDHLPRWIRDAMRPFTAPSDRAERDRTTGRSERDAFGAWPDPRWFFGPAAPCGDDRSGRDGAGDDHT